MQKGLRIGLGGILVAAGIVFFILPGSILFLVLGLFVLSYDIPRARLWLKKCQDSMATGARRLDRFVLNRKLK